MLRMNLQSIAKNMYNIINKPKYIHRYGVNELNYTKMWQ